MQHSRGCWTKWSRNIGDVRSITSTIRMRRIINVKISIRRVKIRLNIENELLSSKKRKKYKNQFRFPETIVYAVHFDE